MEALESLGRVDFLRMAVSSFYIQFWYYTDGEDIFIAQDPRSLPPIHQKGKIDLTEFQGIRIPPEEVYAAFDPDEFALADPLPPHCFLKRPRLISYEKDSDGNERIKELVLSEARV